MTTAYALVAPLRMGEEAKRAVRLLGIGRADLKVGRRDGMVLIPLQRPIDPPMAGTHVEVVEFNSSRPPKNYKDVVQVPERFRPALPTSFDMVGDLVLIKIPPDLRVYGPAIAEAILKTHKNVKGVFHDDGVEGPFRIRKLVPIAGVARTRTTHTEFSVPLVVDVAKAYFSPRLANEHNRVARAVQLGETVLDATAGVGPFAVQIAKLRRAAKVVAIDLNPEAVALLRENVRAHRLDDVVDVIEGNAVQAVSQAPPCDRAVVNLPHGGEEILEACARKAKPGAILHYYRVWPEPEKAAREGELLQRIEAAAGRAATVVDSHVVHAYSPTDRLYALDVRLAP